MGKGKGAATRQKILEESIQLFNTQGYQGTSFKDITQRTGIQKGGIYNHFENKQDLEVQAFDLAIDKIRARSREMLQNQQHTIDRIKGVVAVFRTFMDAPLIDGGCIILNTTIEADDTNPVLLERSREAMDEWRHYIIRCVNKGQARSEIRADVDAETLATFVLSSLEGSIMMSKLYGDNGQLAAVADYLNGHLEELRVADG